MKRQIALALLLCVFIFISACGENTGGVETPVPAPTVRPMSESAGADDGTAAFRVKNSIGGDIYEMRISPNNQDEFGEDILKDKILKQSESTDVSFIPPDTYTYWDLRVLTENGNIYTWTNIVLGSFREIELKIGSEGPEFSAY